VAFDESTGWRRVVNLVSIASLRSNRLPRLARFQGVAPLVAGARRLPFFKARWNETYGWRTAFVLAVLSVSLFAFAHLAEDYVTNDPVVRWDARFNHWLNHEGWRPLVRFFEIATVAGGSAFLLAVTAIATALFALRGLRQQAALVLLAFAGAELTNVALKRIFERPRPPYHDPTLTLDTFAFPSGHATVSVAVYGAVTIVLWRDLPRWRHRVLALLTLAVLLSVIGFSRIYLGAHYFSDVLAGLSVGTAWLMICVLLVTIFEARKHDR
jgi:membrane-associated phospholipid phosphatase